MDKQRVKELLVALAEVPERLHVIGLHTNLFSSYGCAMQHMWKIDYQATDMLRRAYPGLVPLYTVVVGLNDGRGMSLRQIAQWLACRVGIELYDELVSYEWPDFDANEAVAPTTTTQQLIAA